MVANEWYGCGLGSLLLHALIAAAAIAGVTRLEGPVLRENHAMLELMKELGFVLSRCQDDAAMIRASKVLRGYRRPLVVAEQA